MPQPDPGTTAPLSATTRHVVIPHRATRLQRIVARTVYLLIRSVSLTLRWRVRPGLEQRIRKHQGRGIYVVWHNRLALCLVIYERYVRPNPGDRRLAAMVSASRDGALLSRILELFHVEPARGSSSRRGPQALRELVTWAEQGFDLALTPDGPRGPRYVVQEGVIAAAQLTGLAIVPVTYRLGWKIRLKSWDGFLIPLPFSWCEVDFAEPLSVSRDTDAATRETLRQQLETTLRAMATD